MLRTGTSVCPDDALPFAFFGAGGNGDVDDCYFFCQSLPMLLVDLGRVCGFRLTRTEDAEAVGGRVRAALHESFRERSEELFETGSAVHADTFSLAEVI